MKIIRQQFLPIGKRYGAINLFGVLFAKPSMNLTPEVINHEKIHSRQLRELGYIFFYILYLFEWVVLLFRYRFDSYRAYRNISFEREAYKHGDDLGYLRSRRPYSMWRR